MHGERFGFCVSEATKTYERERKFVVRDGRCVDTAVFTYIVQAYLFAKNGWSQRARFSRFAGMESVPSEVLATYTLKGPLTENGREEYEWPIPLETAVSVMALTDNRVLKLRHQMVAEGDVFDVDVFLGANTGLVVAELESSNPWAAPLPSFATEDVTHNDRFHNDYLAFHPFAVWSDEDRQRYGAVDIGRNGRTFSGL